jgi:hypothetical protein
MTGSQVKPILPLAIALALVLTACGQGASDKPAASPAAPAPAASAPTPAAASPAPPAPLAAGDSIAYATVAEARAALSQRKDVQSREDNGWFIVADQSLGAFWSFTPAGHAASPALVKRTIHEKDGVVSVALAMLCEGPKTPCDELKRQFEELDERMRADLQRQSDAQKK